MKHRRSLIVTTTLTLLASLAAPVDAATAALRHHPPSQPKPSPSSPQGRASASSPNDRPPLQVAPGDRRRVLGADWRASRDRAWSTIGDATGFHVLVSDKNNGYRWRTAATLSEPGFDADMWIGNACVTGSGRRAVVAYAPRAFTNKPDLMLRGAFTAVVDLQSGKVRKLATRSSLAYFSPGCGASEKAVFTQYPKESKNASRLVAVGAADGTVERPVELAGQITSAVPVSDGFAAADSARIVKITSSGVRTPVASAKQVPFQLSPDSDGGIVFLDREPVPGASAATGAQRAVVRRVEAVQIKKSRTGRPVPAVPSGLADGPLHGVDLTRSASGQVFITGAATARAALPAPITLIKGTPREAKATTHAEALVTRTAWAGGRDPRDPRAGSGPTKPHPTDIDITALNTQQKARFQVVPSGGTGTAERSPLLKAAADDPIDADARCAVPRNSTVKHALQPTPRQAEWAVNQAITNNLNKHINRPAGWMKLGMGAYQPQTLFPLKSLSGGGRVPSQVFLGILAQESNMWQASRVVMPGATGNPLIGNYYGIAYNPDGTQGDPWKIDYSKSDCGYGISQVTDGMTKGSSLTPLQQEAVALDYTANIAAGVNILIDKWNQTKAEGLVVDNGDPKWAENWFFALWAYNAGYHPKSEASKYDGKWGVGWTNNPANPLWKFNRTPFLENSAGADDYEHASHPQDWPYQEKVLGWAGRPLFAAEAPGKMVAGFRAAWWTSAQARTMVKPPEPLFCTSANMCDSSKIGDNDQNKPGLGACNHKDLYCWWTTPVSWKSCAGQWCANEVLRFDSTYPEQPNGISYPSRCDTTGLPSGVLVIDDVPDSTPIHRYCGNPPTPTSGTFTLDFATPSGKIDLHQIGAAYGGHFWFTHTRLPGAESGRLKTTGTWRLNRSLAAWTRIMVHLPDHGAHTQQAKYEIDLGDGAFSRTRYINQKRMANNWVSLGVYQINGTPRVRLGSETEDGDGSDDIAWDAIAFQPLSAKPKHMVAALGDSYSSGEGAGSYYAETDSDHGDNQRWNACRRSKNAWPRKVVLPGTSTALGSLADDWSKDAELGFVACSGAQSKNVWESPWSAAKQPYSEGQFHEIAQVNSGVLSKDTTLVMLTIGGNDERAFTNAIMECAYPTNCADDDFIPRYKGLVDSSIIPNLSILLKEVAAKAPNARIVLMGYPELFSRTVKCTGSVWFDLTETKALAELVNYAGTKQRALVDSLRTGSTSKLKIEYADPVSAFVGHGGCDADEWINKIVSGPNGDGDFHRGDPVTEATNQCALSWLVGCLSREAFHPKGAGTSGYAGVMQARLGQIGYP